MRDLPRLIHHGANDFERALLRSHESEAGPEQVLGRTLAAVGLSTAVVTSSPSLSAAATKASAATLEVGGTMGTSLGTTALAKWVALGALGVAGASGVWFAARPTQEPGNVTELKLVASASGADPMPVEERPVATPREDVIPIEELATAEDEGTDGARAGSNAARKKAPAQSLTEEIQAVSEIRDNLSQPAAALQAIARYQARFPRGRLQQEVTVLRIIALQSSGQHAQARALGERFLTAHPESAHAKRIRSVLGMKP